MNENVNVENVKECQCKDAARDTKAGKESYRRHLEAKHELE